MALRDESYFENFTATGGSGTGYTWSVTSGTALSAVGLSLTSGGVISGYPNATETAAPFTVQVTDSQGNSATQDYALTIYSGFSISPATLPDGTVGTPYSQLLTSSGGAGGPFTFSVVSGTALSAVSLSLSPAGLISGTPSATESAAPLDPSGRGFAGRLYTSKLHAHHQRGRRAADDIANHAARRDSRNALLANANSLRRERDRVHMVDHRGSSEPSK